MRYWGLPTKQIYSLKNGFYYNGIFHLVSNFFEKLYIEGFQFI